LDYNKRPDTDCLLFGGCPSQDQGPPLSSSGPTATAAGPSANTLASASLADFNKLTPEQQEKLIKRMRRIEEEKDNRVLPKPDSGVRPQYPVVNAFPRS